MFILSLLTVISPYTTIIPVIYMTYMVLFKKVNIYKNHWNIGLFILFIWALIVGIINYSFPSFVTAFALFLYLCVSIFMQNYFNNENKVEKLCTYLVSFSIPAAIFGFIEKAIYVYFDVNIWASFLEFTSQKITNNRIYSSFGNPNVAGNWFAIMIIISLYFCSTKTKTTKLYYQLATILFIIALYLTGSRGALIGLLFGVFMFYLLKGGKKDMWIFIMIFIITVVVTFMPPQILKSVTGHNFAISFNSRLEIWGGCLKMIKIKPITGWGLMGITNNGAEFMKGYYFPTLYHGHNIWITIMTSLGAIGIFIYLYMKINLFLNLKTLYSQKNRVVPMLAGIQAVIIGHGLVDFTMIAPQTGLLFIASSAIVSSLIKQNNSSKIDDNSNEYKYEKISEII